MRLSRLKIRGLGDVPETCWMTIDPHLTIFRIGDRTTSHRLLRAIQAINPDYAYGVQQPFRDYPTEIISNDGYRKRIDPEKRTVGLAVFNASSSLVTELGSITSTLYATDRIEVGRKLDYSCWINFVELASSCRWSDVSADIGKLMETDPPLSRSHSLANLVGGMKETDRIRGEAMDILSDWLNDLRGGHADQELIGSLISKIRRASYFADARRVVAARMPLFVSMHRVDLFRSAADVSPVNSADTGRYPPVVLLDLLDVPETDTSRLLEVLGGVASQNQYLCFVSEHCPLRPGTDLTVVGENDILAAGAPTARRTH
jgi:hypothetical protein